MKTIFEDDTVARTPRNASQLTMKVLYVAFAVVSAVSALQNTYAPNYNELTSGQYVPDDSGRYVPDDSGRYIPDHSGEYHHDGLGGYAGDGTGAYAGDGSGAYKGDGSGGYKGGAGGNGFGSGGNRFGSGGSAFGQGGNRGSGGSFLGSSSFHGLGSGNLLGSGSNENTQTVKPTNPYGSGGAFGNTGSSTSQSSAKYGSSGSSSDFSSSRYADGRWKIIRQTGDIDTDGYHWEYETENRITAEESGKLANKGSENEAMRAKGFYEYTGPDNAVYHVSYTSDENGFLPEGQHLPTPPPIPGEIVKSLEFLKSIGKL